MRKPLRLLAALLAVITLLTWVITGAHFGWTRTEITEMRVDPVTEIEYPETRKGFVAGVEILGGGLGLAALLWTLSLFVNPSINKP